VTVSDGGLIADITTTRQRPIPTRGTYAYLWTLTAHLIDRAHVARRRDFRRRCAAGPGLCRRRRDRDRTSTDSSLSTLTRRMASASCSSSVTQQGCHRLLCPRPWRLTGLLDPSPPDRSRPTLAVQAGGKACLGPIPNLTVRVQFPSPTPPAGPGRLGPTVC
jgi:hypothetical protein